MEIQKKSLADAEKYALPRDRGSSSSLRLQPYELGLFRCREIDPENGAEGVRVVTRLTRRQDVATIVVTVRDESARGRRGEHTRIETTREIRFGCSGKGGLQQVNCTRIRSCG